MPALTNTTTVSDCQTPTGQVFIVALLTIQRLWSYNNTVLYECVYYYYYTQWKFLLPWFNESIQRVRFTGTRWLHT